MKQHITSRAKESCQGFSFFAPSSSVTTNVIKTLGLTLMLFFTLNVSAQTATITLTSQEVMWIDANKCSDQGPRGAWLSFTITNPNATALTNVVVTFAGFTGANPTDRKSVV